ncbi:tRNA preQ1(34) S-adenosylmethionine ribosyltransferase-isomerase QueA [Deferribacter autotrophicus]|uniref:S-adenosylmethionine:tRNA ribosyltransferase-isomerase n=1 Tax=Deferribacter autotrophicus TaxID=500465 RepID=A0A5A8F8D4_9BACT|nr:tRNA preQ1(34) S-adenosylmethionine ribosyltransferase-isomerase QueA [Deferribacter autotrophicus]KAA0258682.1 tRNA preQ1(34) S-adenosylmethionine ribosyltransferase-isomerase QueA [Deferribacter autotrophicus]
MGKTSIERYNFNLDESLIAQFPADKRGESRLLVVNRASATFNDMKFKDIVSLIDSDSFLVVNNTKVLKARLFGKKKSGGRIEVLLLEQLDNKKFRAMIGGKWKREDEIYIDEFKIAATGRDAEGLVIVDFLENDPFMVMEQKGHIPLPPYIKRSDTEIDQERYNTVYSKNYGSVAAPTAGLHFTNEILKALKEKGVEILEITLNVGLGTFRPIKTEFIEDHQMHSENFTIDSDVATRINKLKNEGKKLIAVGTTVVRALESAASDDGVVREAKNQSTNLFIKEGYRFKIVDKLITNFHLPKSTLFILVTAFGGYDLIMNAYKHAMKNRYRFFSYGDAMFVE